MTKDELFKRYKHNPEALHNFVSQVAQLVWKYGEHNVLWAVEQMEKKYDIRK